MDEKKLDFETALNRLDNIVKSLENGTVALDKSLELFEQGVKLIKYCNSQLDNAEQKVKILTLNSDGEYEESKYSVNE